MTSVDTLSSLSGTAASSTASATRDRLGQKDFLELMLAQVRNQDPLKPLDGAQFIGQLAQFSTVTGIEEMSASLASLAESMRSDQMLAGTALVGREVLMQSSDAVLEESGEVRGAIEVPEGVQQVLITVRDAAGQIVRQLARGDQEAAQEAEQHVPDGARVQVVEAGQQITVQVAVDARWGALGPIEIEGRATAPTAGR